jgi:hypothetical protein
MRRIIEGSLGRVIAGLVMGAVALAMIATFAPIGPVRFMGGTLAALLVAALVIVSVAALSRSVRRMWGALCLVDGVLGIALAGVSFKAGGQPLWPSDLGYQHDVGPAVESWLRHEIGAGATYFGAALGLAAVLLALSWFLLRSHHGRHGDVH